MAAQSADCLDILVGQSRVKGATAEHETKKQQEADRQEKLAEREYELVRLRLSSQDRAPGIVLQIGRVIVLLVL